MYKLLPISSNVKFSKPEKAEAISFYMFKDVVELWAECICLMLCVNMLNVFSPDIRPTKRSALGLGC